MAFEFVEGDQVSVIIADLDLFTRGEIVALGLNINANLRENPPIGTPVDLGWARANWVPSVGAPFVGQSDIRDPSPQQIAARMQVAEQGLNNLLAWTPAAGPIFSTNNVPYIGALNNGHSPQSPRGFVQFAIERAVKETYSAGANKAARNRRAAASRAGRRRPAR